MGDIGVLAVFCHKGDALIQRINVDSILDESKKLVCYKWKDLTPLSIEFYYEGDGGKQCFVETNSELQALASFCWAKGRQTTEINVKLKEPSGNLVVFDGASSTNVGCSDLTNSSNTEGKLSLKSSGWSEVFKNVGQRFKGGAVEFRQKLLQYSIDSGYKFKFVRNDPNRVTVECLKKIDSGCKWKIHAAQKLKMRGFFEIKKLDKEHTCGIGCRNTTNPSFTSKLVKSLIIEEVRDQPSVRPKEIISRFQRDYGMPINYYHAYTGKGLALKEIHGDESLSYHRLSFYIEALKESNPNSHVALETDPESRKFQRLFVAFGAWIFGFHHCCPVIFLDVMFLKGKYKGCMLTATGKSGNEGFFPLAFAIVDSENEDNWVWFMQHLKKIVPDGKLYTFISNRHTGLVKAVLTIFTGCHHGFCYWHLKASLISAIPSKDPRRNFIVNTIFKNLAYAATHAEFQKHYEDLTNTGCNQAIDFLKGVPSENWANAYFPGKRYGDLSSPIAENFNSWITDARELPITAMIDSIRKKETMKMSDNRESARNWTSMLCPEMEKKVEARKELAKTMSLTKCDEFIFEVHSSKAYRVDLSVSQCSCNMWHIESFPCVHATACIMDLGLPIYKYVEKYFYATTFRLCYEHSIEPVLMNNDPNEVPEVALVLPPDVRRTPGRPREKRTEKSDARPKRKIKCSRCNTYGNHNKNTCTVQFE